jgi:hypothetical protein
MSSPLLRRDAHIILSFDGLIFADPLTLAERARFPGAMFRNWQIPHANAEMWGSRNISSAKCVLAGLRRDYKSRRYSRKLKSNIKRNSTSHFYAKGRIQTDWLHLVLRSHRYSLLYSLSSSSPLPHPHASYTVLTSTSAPVAQRFVDASEALANFPVSVVFPLPRLLNQHHAWKRQARNVADEWAVGLARGGRGVAVIRVGLRRPRRKVTIRGRQRTDISPQKHNLPRSSIGRGEIMSVRNREM